MLGIFLDQETLGLDSTVHAVIEIAFPHTLNNPIHLKNRTQDLFECKLGMRRTYAHTTQLQHQKTRKK